MRNLGARRWWAPGAVSLALVAVGVDTTVFTVALPTFSQGAARAAEALRSLMIS